MIRLKWWIFIRRIWVGEPTLTTFYLLGKYPEIVINYLPELAMLTFSARIRHNYINDPKRFLYDAENYRWGLFKPYAETVKDVISLIAAGAKVDPNAERIDMDKFAALLKRLSPNDYWKLTKNGIDLVIKGYEYAGRT